MNVKGIVQSTSPGGGHEPGVANNCNLDPALHPQLNGATAYAACIEIWGKNVTIDSTTLGSKDGANADPIRAPDRAWVDVFAANNISITGSQNASYLYAVHANACDTNNAGQAPCSNSFGGLLTVKANNDVNLTGRALQATALALGGNGGNVFVHAGNNVAFTNGSIDATAHTGSSNDAGGTVEVKAFNGGVTSTGSIQARGDGLANPGSTDLISCAAVTFAGTIDPAEGNVGNNTGTCGGAPSIPSTVSGYIVFHPEIGRPATGRPASASPAPSTRTRSRAPDCRAGRTTSTTPATHRSPSRPPTPAASTSSTTCPQAPTRSARSSSTQLAADRTQPGHGHLHRPQRSNPGLPNDPKLLKQRQRLRQHADHAV